MGTKRGLLISFSRTGGIFFLQFVSNVLIARLLTPEEVGIFSVAVAATGILQALREFGVGRYLIQERELNARKISTAFGTALAIAWALGVCVYSARGFIASIYDEPIIEELLVVIAITFFAVPFGQPALALMRREGRFFEVAWIMLAATGGGAVVSVGLAAAGWGPVALAYGSLANVLIGVVLALSRYREHLRLRPSLAEWRTVWRFGFLASGAGLATELNSSVPNLVVGRLLGFEAVGLFSRAGGVAVIFDRFFTAAVQWVVGPAMAASLRNGAGITPIMLRSTDLCLIAGWPALIFLAFKAEAIIWVLYGEVWLPAAPLVQALCVSRGLQLLVAQNKSVYEGAGAVGLLLRNEVVMTAVSITIVMYTATISIEAVAWGRTLNAIAYVAIHFSVIRRYGSVAFFEYAGTFYKAALVALGFAALLFALTLFEGAGDELRLTVLLLEALLVAMGYVILVWVTRHPFGPEMMDALRAFPAYFEGARRRTREH